MAKGGLSSSIRWTMVATLGEVARTVFAILLARLIGPEEFGIAAQAIVFVGIVTVLLDQGFNTALIQREAFDPELPGAIVTVNFAIGLVLGGLTIAVAPLWATFMHTQALREVLIVLAASLLIRSLTITPRAILMRNMRFRAIGTADMSAAIVGGAVGLAVAITTASYWAMVVQIVTADLTVLVVFMAVGAGARPNFHFRHLRDIAAFSWRAFVAGFLANAISRNIDNLLVGRFQGPTALAFYGLAYRLLMIPVVLATFTVGTVLFPAFSRLADNVPALAVQMARSIRATAALFVPAMALVGVAAPQLVLAIFGSQWAPAIPIVEVLALAGAVQAVYRPSTSPLLLGVGHAKLNLRYAVFTSVVTVVGIVAGLAFGPLGVAIGYCAATVVLLPVEWLIRKQILGMSIAGQLAALLPACHIAIWVAATYAMIAAILPSGDPAILLIGVAAALLSWLLVLRIAHPALLTELVHMTRRLIGRGGPVQDPVPES